MDVNINTLQMDAVQISTNQGNDAVIVQEAQGEQKENTTSFVDDANVVRRDESFFARPSRDLYSTSESQMTEQAIKDFFMKPITLATGSFSTTDTPTTFVTRYLPSALFNAAPGGLWTDKIKGFLGIRMTMNFKLVVNANRFQQGRYIMGYVPFGGASYDGIGIPLTNNNLRLPTLVQRTTVPHVELDLNCDTSAELSIPYSSVRTFFPAQELSVYPPLLNTLLGSINIYPYVPLETVSGSTTASWRLYAWLTDVELIGAASPQSGLLNKEISNKTNGIVSAPLSAISRGFKEFEEIPVLSSYAHTISWISDRMARAASIFGLSKPTQGDSLQKMLPLSAPSHSNIDGDSDVRSLAFNMQPGVQAIHGLSGTSLDEMDFSFIASKFAWINTSVWSLTDDVNDSIVSHSVMPHYWISVGNSNSHVPVSFIASMFRKWRGSLKFRFKFIKTEFHSGRLAFSFFPNTTGFNNTAIPEFVNRVIVDIREHNEIEIIVPFISPAQYLDYGDSIGLISISVIDPLIAPATVVDHVTIISEIAGGPDIEFSQPSKIGTPTFIVPQSGLNECSLYSTTIGSTQVNANPILSSAISAGDKVSSFRSLIKRYSPVRWSQSSDPAVNVWNNYRLSIISDGLALRGSTTLTNYLVADAYTMVASCFSIIGGGIRYRDVISCNKLTKNESPIIASFHDGNGLFISGGSPIVGVHSHQPLVIQELRHNSIISVEVPQYSKYVGKASSDLFSTTAFPYNAGLAEATGNGLDLTFTVPSNSGPILASTSTATLHSLYRAAADDTNFYGFVSVPPLTPDVYDTWQLTFA